MSSAALEELLDRLTVREESHVPPPPLSFREIGYGYRTGRSFGYSVLLHQFVVLIIVFSSHYVFVRTVEAVPTRFDTAEPIGKVLYLPTLGGGSEGAGKAGGGSGSDPELSHGVRARSRRGFAYPGPQPVVSDPPRATLGIQTILQPALINPPLLKQFLPLPNIAQPAEVAVAEPPKPVRKVLAGELSLRAPAEKPVLAPKITLPVAAASQAPALDDSEPIVPRLLPAKPVIPAPAQVSDVPVEHRKQALLVLNAVPPPPDAPRNTPRAEARSLFAVAPGDVTVIADPGAGSKGGGQPSMAAGTGTPADVPSGDALAEAAAGGSAAKNSTGSGTGTGGRYGSGKGSGLNPAGVAEGAGSGRGTTVGGGTGAGAGTTLGSGKGAGSAAGSGGFPGITISGGRYGNGSGDPAGLHAALTPHHQTSYSMTITSTASSGGGLPDFGVFQNEKIYTVYLDMRANEEDHNPSWILQYAVLQPPAATDRIRGTPTPPYATLKQVPDFTPEIAAKCAHQMIVASAVLNVTGQLEQLSVKQSPDPQVNGPLIEALKNWTFQPAQVDGKPVALKILLGIRASAAR